MWVRHAVVQERVETVAASQVLTAPATVVKAAAAAASAPSGEGQVLVKSPIIGTFYEPASPGTPPFVRIGEEVQLGKVLCTSSR